MSVFVPAHAVVGPGDTPHVALVVHGVFGSGQNWRAVARRLSDARPTWRFVLVDLRHHGGSRGAPRPSTLAAAADDLAALATALGVLPTCVIGHSLGGKVALEYARRHGGGLTTLWVLDSVPGARPHARAEKLEAYRVLDALRALPVPLERRADVVPTLVGAGLAPGIAQWMTTNLRREGDGYVWSFELDGIEELLADYFAQDLWSFLAEPRETPEIHVVVAEESDRLTPGTRRRALALPAAARVTTHLLPSSGHWVHVDNPDALLAMILPTLSE